MLFPNLKGRKIVLASKSPRRQHLLAGLEIPFEVRIMDVDESFPPDLRAGEIPLYLADKKAQAFVSGLTEEEIVITADTVVWINDHVLNKPEDRNEAIAMLRELSGAMHTVYTGVCISTADRRISFVDETNVYFCPLTEDEISHYVDSYRPFDKAGAYGVQELIGYIGIDRLEGSYFNVMGLPVRKLYEALRAL